MDTVLLPGRWHAERTAAMVARERLGEYPDEIRGKLFAVDDTLVALQRLGSARARNLAKVGRQGADRSG